MTKIINLYAGPGAGKSTSAAFIYYLLKDQGLKEYIKKLDDNLEVVLVKDSIMGGTYRCRVTEAYQDNTKLVLE